MREFSEQSCHYKIFDSVGELADRGALQVPAKNEDRLKGTLSREFAGRKFADYAAAGAALHQRWDDGLETLERMRGELAGCRLPQPKSRRRRLRWDETNGDEIDLDRLRAGQEFWRTSRREAMIGPATRTILVDQGANCQVKHQDILWRGAAAILLTEAMEEAGYRVELWVYSLATQVYRGNTSHESFVGAQIKAAGDPVDTSTLVNAVSGWFFRTRTLHERCLSGSTVSYGIGSHRQAGAAQFEHLTPDSDRIIVDNVWSQRDAVALAQRTLQAMQ